MMCKYDIDFDIAILSLDELKEYKYIYTEKEDLSTGTYMPVGGVDYDSIK